MERRNRIFSVNFRIDNSFILDVYSMLDRCVFLNNFTAIVRYGNCLFIFGMDMSILIVRCEELSIGIVLRSCRVKNILIPADACKFNIIKRLAYFVSRRIPCIGIKALEVIVHPLYAYYVCKLLIGHLRSRILGVFRIIFIGLPFNCDLALFIKLKFDIFIGICSIILRNCIKYLYMTEFVIWLNCIRRSQLKAAVEVFVSFFNK